MTAEYVLNAYVDANIVLISVALIWFCAKWLMGRTALRSAYKVQLNVLYALIAMVVASPFIAAGLDALEQSRFVQSRLHISDFLVAQFLEGNISMAPTEFERLLSLRKETIHDVASLNSWTGFGIIAGLAFGFTVVVLRNARDTLQLSRMIHKSFLLRRVGKIDIRCTHETRVPFSTRGLFRRYIVLPTDLLAQENDVRIAVAHEIQHVRQGDLTWEIALELIRPFFFWNPAFVYCKRDVERLRELACDQQVLHRSGHLVRDYCECLLRVCRISLMGQRSNQIITPSVPFVQIDSRIHASHSSSFLKQRIVSVLETKAFTGRRGVGPALILLALTIALTASVVLKPTNHWSHDRLMLSTIVNLERLNNR